MLILCLAQLCIYMLAGCLGWVFFSEKVLLKEHGPAAKPWIHGFAGAALTLGMGLCFDTVAIEFSFFSCAAVITLCMALIYDGKTALASALIGAPLQLVRLLFHDYIKLCLTESAAILLTGVIFFIIRRFLLESKKTGIGFCAFSALFVSALNVVLYPAVCAFINGYTNTLSAKIVLLMAAVNISATVLIVMLAQKIRFGEAAAKNDDADKNFNRIAFTALATTVVFSVCILYGFMTVIYRSIAEKEIQDNFSNTLTYMEEADENGWSLTDALYVCDEEKLIITDENGNVLTRNGASENTVWLDIEYITGHCEEYECYTDEFEDKQYMFSYVRYGKYYIFGVDDYTNTYKYRTPMVILFTGVEIIAMYLTVIFISIRIKKGLLSEAESINETLEKLSGRHADKKTGGAFNMLGNSLAKNMKGYVERISDEMRFAADVQKQSLPMPQYMQNGVSIRVAIRPARQVCGDFYDYFMLDADRVAFLIADVSGKGLSAAMFMMRAKAAFRSVASEESTIESMMGKVNEALCEGNSEGMFVTAFVGIIDSKTGVIQYINAGQGAPALRPAGEDYRLFTENPQVPLGILQGKKYSVQTLVMRPGSRLVLYTDGVTEANNPKEEMLGEERLLSFLNESCRTENGKDTVNLLQEEIEIFSDSAEQFDDIAIMVVDYFGRCDTVEYTEKLFRAEDSQLDTATGFIHDRLADCDPGAADQMKIDLAFEELFVNVSHYAYGTEKGNLALGVATAGNLAFVRLKDGGVPFNPLLKRKNSEEVPLKERREGGLGIIMVKECMNYVQYEYKDGKNIFTMIKVIQ